MPDLLLTLLVWLVSSPHHLEAADILICSCCCCSMLKTTRPQLSRSHTAQHSAAFQLPCQVPNPHVWAPLHTAQLSADSALISMSGSCQLAPSLLRR